MAGDERTGVSIMRLTAGLDSGPVCAAEPETIGREDTYGTLAPRLEQLGARLLLGVRDAKADGDPPRFVEQDEHGVTYAEKIESDDRTLDPARTAVELDRVVRALHPHIGARAALADGTFLGVRERRRRRRRQARGRPTMACSRADGRLLLDAPTARCELLVVQPPGGRPMPAEAYLRGRGLAGRP